ncbi:MAG: PilZ domain-containing protein [Candidatus Omnitrophota bacterium]
MEKYDEVGRDNRLFERKNFSCLLKFKTSLGDLDGEGMLRNISGGGVCFVTKEKLMPRERLDLWINVPDCPNPIHKDGEVVWAKENLVDTQETGVRFNSVNLMQLARVFR